jgi:hypothetical protein
MLNAKATTAVLIAMVGVLDAGRIVTNGVSTPPILDLTNLTPRVICVAAPRGRALREMLSGVESCPRGAAAREIGEEGVVVTEESDQELEAARVEIDRLRSENEQLRAGDTGVGRGRWVRSTAVVVLFVLGALLVPTAGIAVWSRNTILNTDRYVETVAPLSDEPAVIDAVANRLTTAIFERVDVQSELQKYLPPRLLFAAGPIANQVESTTHDLIVKALESEQFDTLWRGVNRTASTALVAYVNSDGSSAVTIENGQLFLDLGPILDSVKQSLTDQGFALASRIPSTSAEVRLPVGDVSAIQQLKSILHLLNVLAYLLPLLALACFIAAVFLMRDRRRGVVIVGVIVAGSALLLAVGLAIGREAYLNAATDGGANPDTAAVLFDTLVRFLRNGIRVFFLVGVLLAIGAVVTGPSAWAVRTRKTVGGVITSGGERTGWDSGAFGSFFARHRFGLMGSAVVVMAIWLFTLSPPTPGSVLWLTLGLLVLLVAIQFVAATAPPQVAEADPSDDGTGQQETKEISV